MSLEKILLFLIGFYIIYFQLYKNDTIENFKWMKRDSCKYKTNKTLLHVLKKYGIGKGDLVDWNMYVPCSYNNVDLELRSIPPQPNKKIFIIHNCDAITSKNNLWKIILNKYGLGGAKKIMPETYILKNFDNSIDRDRFVQGYEKGKLYILKKNIQRQRGLKITNKPDDVLYGANKGYVIAQDLLQNPYLINGRKINLRIYLLIVCKNNKIEAFAHKNGFMYYTATKFKKNSTDIKYNVTTGYDRKIYATNPLTLEDFRYYLDNTYRKLYPEESKLLYNSEKISDALFYKIYQMLNKVINAADGHICGTKNVPSHISGQTSFQLFGVDVAVDNSLCTQIMEINKGPDLNAKDERDKQVKINVITDILTTLGLTEEKINNFIKIY